MSLKVVLTLSLVQVLLRRSNSVDHMATQPHQLQLSDKKGVLSDIFH